jgi:ribosomal protein S12 methylthiotransferase accessory factor YcaO
VEAGAPSRYDLRLYSVLLPSIRNLSYFHCVVQDDESSYIGSGCFSSPDMAVARAVSEAMQAVSACYSGSREDLEDEQHDVGWDPEDRSPTSIDYAEYSKRVVSRSFNDLRTELRFLVRWLHDAGHPVTYVANLTRRGIEFPVVKAIVPGLMIERESRVAQHYSTSRAMRHRYGTG